MLSASGLTADACDLGTAERETLLQVKQWKERLWKEKQIREQNRK